MSKLFAILPAAILTHAIAIPSALAQAVFTDDFEAATLNAFWTPFLSPGSTAGPSSAQAHTGNQSLRLTTPLTSSVTKTAGVRHLFSPATYGRVSVWLNDTGAGISSSNYFTLHTGPFALGTWDYDLGPSTGGQYVLNAPGLSTNTGVLRTPGWHHFVIEVSPTASVLKVDGTTVYSGPGGVPLPEVQLEMHAPYWRPGFTVYFDDFYYSPCGQANSPCATLTVNGVGATGYGPFPVAAPAGTNLSLNWSGPANQPLVLFASPALLPGQTIFGNLVVDLDLSSTATLFSGLDPMGSLLFTTNAQFGAYGTSQQTLPTAAAAVGLVINLQGLVLDFGATCPSNPRMMTTASFRVQL